MTNDAVAALLLANLAIRCGKRTEVKRARLLVRQLVVARRQKSYNDDDQQFIKASLQALTPQDDFEVAFKGLGKENVKLRLDNF